LKRARAHARYRSFVSKRCTQRCCPSFYFLTFVDCATCAINYARHVESYPMIATSTRAINARICGVFLAERKPREYETRITCERSNARGYGKDFSLGTLITDRCRRKNSNERESPSHSLSMTIHDVCERQKSFEHGRNLVCKFRRSVLLFHAQRVMLFLSKRITRIHVHEHTRKRAYIDGTKGRTKYFAEFAKVHRQFPLRGKGRGGAIQSDIDEADELPITQCALIN